MIIGEETGSLANTVVILFLAVIEKIFYWEVKETTLFAVVPEMISFLGTLIILHTAGMYCWEMLNSPIGKRMALFEFIKAACLFPMHLPLTGIGVIWGTILQ